MKRNDPNVEYPILAVRLKKKDMAYLRREADQRGLTIAKYVRAVLLPFAPSVEKTGA